MQTAFRVVPYRFFKIIIENQDILLERWDDCFGH